MDKLKTGLLFFAVLIAAVCCSFYFEADYRKLIRYLYELTSGGKILFILPKKYLHFISVKFILAFSLFAIGLFLLLVKKTGSQILINLLLAVFLFSLSAIVHTWLDGVSRVIECTVCNDTMRLSYYDVDYDLIFLSGVCIAFLPLLITEINHFIKIKSRLP